MPEDKDNSSNNRNPVIERALREGFKSGGEIGDIGGGTGEKVVSSGGGRGGAGSGTSSEVRRIGVSEAAKQATKSGLTETTAQKQLQEKTQQEIKRQEQVKQRQIEIQQRDIAIASKGQIQRVIRKNNEITYVGQSGSYIFPEGRLTFSPEQDEDIRGGVSKEGIKARLNIAEQKRQNIKQKEFLKEYNKGVESRFIETRLKQEELKKLQELKRQELLRLKTTPLSVKINLEQKPIQQTISTMEGIFLQEFYPKPELNLEIKPEVQLGIIQQLQQKPIQQTISNDIFGNIEILKPSFGTAFGEKQLKKLLEVGRGLKDVGEFAVSPFIAGFETGKTLRSITPDVLESLFGTSDQKRQQARQIVKQDLLEFASKPVVQQGAIASALVLAPEVVDKLAAAIFVPIQVEDFLQKPTIRKGTQLTVVGVALLTRPTIKLVKQLRFEKAVRIPKSKLTAFDIIKTEPTGKITTTRLGLKIIEFKRVEPSFPIIEKSTGAILKGKQTQLFGKYFEILPELSPSLSKSSLPKGRQLTLQETPAKTFSQIRELQKTGKLPFEDIVRSFNKQKELSIPEFFKPTLKQTELIKDITIKKFGKTESGKEVLLSSIKKQYSDFGKLKEVDFLIDFEVPTKAKGLKLFKSKKAQGSLSKFDTQFKDTGFEVFGESKKPNLEFEKKIEREIVKEFNKIDRKPVTFLKAPYDLDIITSQQPASKSFEQFELKINPIADIKIESKLSTPIKEDLFESNTPIIDIAESIILKEDIIDKTTPDKIISPPIIINPEIEIPEIDLPSPEIEPPKEKLKEEIKPPFKFDFGVSPKQKEKQGYDTFVKSKGKFKKVNNEPLPKNKAYNLGQEIVDNTPSATFKYKKSKKNTKIKDDFYKKGFYKFNKVGENKYIEKNKFRIDTRGEKLGITIKGYLARRKEVSFF